MLIILIYFCYNFFQVTWFNKFPPYFYCHAPMACGRFPSWKPPWSMVEHVFRVITMIYSNLNKFTFLHKFSTKNAVSLASPTPGIATRSEPPTTASRLSVGRAGFGHKENFRCGFKCGIYRYFQKAVQSTC